MKKKQKILMAMSGGVDSSVAAALLVEQGYEVTGAFMKQWTDSTDVSGVCTWKQDRRDALRVAAHLDIPLITLDFEEEYKKWVMEYMFREYEAGRTPNPDVLCNKYIKFGVWLDRARSLGFDYLATGHYASIAATKEFFSLMQAKDKNKDQTYFLHQLSQEQLSHTMFPIGEYHKDEVRELAKKFDLPTADRKESMGICFVGKVPMTEFLQQRIQQKKGKIVTSSGVVVGEHDGLAFYTIGQRHLGMKTSDLKMKNEKEDTKPLYVVGKDQEKNELIVGQGDNPLLYKKEIQVIDMHWISGHAPEFPLQCKVRLRHRQELQSAICRMEQDRCIIEFEAKQKAVTPGQFAVLYTKDACLGGGVIS